MKAASPLNLLVLVFLQAAALLPSKTAFSHSKTFPKTDHYQQVQVDNVDLLVCVFVCL